jgi:hypothetical protein
LQVQQVWLLPACIDWRHNFTHEQRDLPRLGTAAVQRHLEKVVGHLQAWHLATPAAATQQSNQLHCSGQDKAAGVGCGWA